MRTRILFAAALLLPSIVSAQARAPRGAVGGTRPGPAPLGAQPEAIARAVSITRSHVSVEAYPFISHASAPALLGTHPAINSTTFGTGSRFDYRLTEYVSWTMDVTASYLGGPTTSQTVESGFRFHPDYLNVGIQPYFDARLGYENASDSYSTAPDVGIGPASPYASNAMYSHGFGAIIGAGADYPLTNTFYLTTGAVAMRTSMSAYNITGISVPTGDDHFHMTTYRLVLGVRYNPVRSVQIAQPAASQSIH